MVLNRTIDAIWNIKLSRKADFNNSDSRKMVSASVVTGSGDLLRENMSSLLVCSKIENLRSYPYVREPLTDRRVDF